MSRCGSSASPVTASWTTARSWICVARCVSTARVSPIRSAKPWPRCGRPPAGLRSRPARGAPAPATAERRRAVSSPGRQRGTEGRVSSAISDGCRLSGDSSRPGGSIAPFGAWLLPHSRRIQGRGALSPLPPPSGHRGYRPSRTPRGGWSRTVPRPPSRRTQMIPGPGHGTRDVVSAVTTSSVRAG